MPADIEQMFSVREVPWHREGHVLADYPQNFAEARVLAGLDWDPVPYPAVVPALSIEELRVQVRERAQEILMRAAARGLKIGETTDEILALWEETDLASDGWSRIARSDTLATLSYQQQSYTVIPNSAFGEIIDSILEAEPGTVRLETGGCLANGKKVWMLVRLNEPHQVKAGGRIDASMTFPFLGLTSDHTGRASLAARLTKVRIVCGNTFSASEAEGQRTGAVYSFSHRGDWRERIGEARAALQFAREESDRYTEAMSDLLGIAVTREQEKLWLAEFLPVPPEGATDRAMANIEEARRVVLGFLDGPTVEGAGIRGTAYGLVQAAGEWADHGRKYLSWESKFTRSMLKPEPLKAKAATLAREAARA